MHPRIHTYTQHNALTDVYIYDNVLVSYPWDYNSVATYNMCEVQKYVRTYECTHRD